jgi:hypothetical protein
MLNDARHTLGDLVLQCVTLTLVFNYPMQLGVTAFLKKFCS